MNPGADQDWEGYWRGTREAAAYRAGGTQEEVLARFWNNFFKQTLPTFPRLRLLDVACGNGVVTRYALEVAGRAGVPAVDAVGLDRSLSGLRDLRHREPGVRAVVADAARAPFRDKSFDLVCSQFGLEYAGVSALGDAARLLADGGILAAILHLKNGDLFRECRRNLDAAIELRESRFLDRAREAFQAVELSRGTGADPKRLRTAGENLARASLLVVRLLGKRGAGVAGGSIDRLHTDINRMFGRAHAFQAGQVLEWIKGMAGEMDTYAGRMSGMLDAALDEAQMAEVKDLLQSQSVAVRACEQLVMGADQAPAAWVLIADRR